MAVYKGDGTSTSFPITFTYAGADTVTGVIEDANGNLKTITSDFYVDNTNKTFNYPGYPPGQETCRFSFRGKTVYHTEYGTDTGCIPAQ